jgi:hypothetical protein
MYRWLEQLELKHVDFERSIQAFGKKVESWTELAIVEREQGRPGHAAYAVRQANVYKGLREEAECVYHRCASKVLVEGYGSGKPVWQRAMDFREGELQRLIQLVSTVPVTRRAKRN